MSPVVIPPFPWFGGKRRVASLVWERFGDVGHYLEPFFGAGAVLLGRPGWPPSRPYGWLETVNDRDGFIANAWRAIAWHGAELNELLDWPVNEVDLHARHKWLIERRLALTTALMADPAYCDVQVAAWWLWGVSQWIGSGWCTGNRSQKRPRIKGWRQRPSARGMGFARQSTEGILPQALLDRMRNVRVLCGDWSRLVGSDSMILANMATAGVFLDPPYDPAGRRTGLYHGDDGESLAGSVRRWCLEHTGRADLRIALCGYAGEHDELIAHGWSVLAWKSIGLAKTAAAIANRSRERIWFSPSCHGSRQTDLFVGQRGHPFFPPEVP